jgi:uncharacterized membrane protein
MVLLLQAQAIIQEAKNLEIATVSQDEILIQATNAFEDSSYTQSERFSQQIIDQTTEIIELATQANEQITNAQELLTEKSNTLDSGTFDLAQVRLDEAIAEYESGRYSSAYTYASESIQLLEQAKPNSQNNNLIYGIGILLIITIFGYYFYSFRNKTVDTIEDAPNIDLDKIFKYKSHLRTDEKAVLRFIGESGGAFITQVRERFDIPKSSAWRMVKRLEEEEVISVSMVGRETYLQLKDPEVMR